MHLKGNATDSICIATKLCQWAKTIVVINKVDKPNWQTWRKYTIRSLNSFLILTQQKNSLISTVYGSSKQGWMGPDYKTPTTDVTYLLDMIIQHVPPPKIESEAFSLWSARWIILPFIGRIAVGRLTRDQSGVNTPVSLAKRDGYNSQVAGQRNYSPSKAWVSQKSRKFTSRRNLCRVWNRKFWDWRYHLWFRDSWTAASSIRSVDQPNGTSNLKIFYSKHGTDFAGLYFLGLWLYPGSQE